MKTFAELNLAEPLLRALIEEGYEVPTPIQAQAIPVIMEGHDVLGCAQTGTGKTAAFAVPILHKLMDKTDGAAHAPGHTNAHHGRTHKKARVLVLSPTRELAQQIAESFKTYGRHARITGTVIYGGVSQKRQEEALHRGVDVIVATPGRLLDLTAQGLVDFSGIHTLVLDESDRMLDMGFIAPIREIVGQLPQGRQTLLFSATMPREILKLANSLLRDPVKISVTPAASAAPLIEQSVYHVSHASKQDLLVELVGRADVRRAVVFTRTKHGADRVCRKLEVAGVHAVAIHGNKNQNQRQRSLDSFKNGRNKVLVATDVAARGLDVDGITHVFNFDLPVEPEAYVHRIGRTGRAGATGFAVAFCDPAERSLLRDIERILGNEIPLAAGSDPAPTSRRESSDRPRQQSSHHRGRPERSDRSERSFSASGGSGRSGYGHSRSQSGQGQGEGRSYGHRSSSHAAPTHAAAPHASRPRHAEESASAKPAHAAHAHTAHPKHAQPRDDHAKAAHPKAAHAKPVHAKAAHAKPEHARSEHAKPTHAGSSHAGSSHAKSAHSKSESHPRAHVTVAKGKPRSGLVSQSGRGARRK